MLVSRTPQPGACAIAFAEAPPRGLATNMPEALYPIGSAQDCQTGEVCLHGGIVDSALCIPTASGFHEDGASLDSVAAFSGQHRVASGGESARWRSGVAPQSQALQGERRYKRLAHTVARENRRTDPFILRTACV